MPEVLFTFLDGEVVRARAELIDFHAPVIQAVTAEPESNNQEFTVPLSSVKYIALDSADDEPDPFELDKVVIHFADGEILRAYAGRETLGGPFGVIYSLVDPGGKASRRIGVPFTAVKAIFKVKEWDSRARAKPARARAKPSASKPKPAASKPKPAAAKPKPALVKPKTGQANGKQQTRFAARAAKKPIRK